MVLQSAYNNLLSVGFIFTITAPTIPVQVYHGYKIEAAGRERDEEMREYYTQRSDNIHRFTERLYGRLEWKTGEREENQQVKRVQKQYIQQHR